jgi:hypothetical protein
MSGSVARKNVKRGLLVVSMLVGLGLAGQSMAANSDPWDGQWHTTFTPYIWLPTLDGTLNSRVPRDQGGSFDVELGPNDYLTNLNFALMLAGDVRNGDWTIGADLDYLDLSANESHIKQVGGTVLPPRERSTDIDVDFKGTVFTLYGGYTLAHGGGSNLDVIVGARGLWLSTDVKWNLASSVEGGDFTFAAIGSSSRDKDFIDGIIGIRGRVALGEGRWYMPYYLDIGTGSTDFTSQAVIGVGYAYDWGDIEFGFRHLGYDQGNDKLLQNVQLNGFAFGASFHF